MNDEQELKSLNFYLLENGNTQDEINMKFNLSEDENGNQYIEKWDFTIDKPTSAELVNILSIVEFNDSIKEGLFKTDSQLTRADETEALSLVADKDFPEITTVKEALTPLQNASYAKKVTLRSQFKSLSL